MPVQSTTHIKNKFIVGKKIMESKNRKHLFHFDFNFVSNFARFSKFIDK